VIGNRKVLQTFDAGGGRPGLNTAYTLDYERARMPWNWVNYDSDLADWFKKAA
jgi:hypothetical protein